MLAGLGGSAFTPLRICTCGTFMAVFSMVLNKPYFKYKLHQCPFERPLHSCMGRKERLAAASGLYPLRGAVLAERPNCCSISSHRVVARVQFPFETAIQAY